MVLPASVKPVGADWATSAITPTPPIAGVGQNARALRLVIKRDIAGDDREIERAAASPTPCRHPTNWPIYSGRSGLPKLRLSVSASGVAPRTVMFRQASATACLPPSTGSAAQ